MQQNMPPKLPGLFPGQRQPDPEQDSGRGSWPATCGPADPDYENLSK